MQNRFTNRVKPCPGPQVTPGHTCPTGATVTPEQGPRARRCRECAYARNSMRTVEGQRRRRERKRAERAELKQHAQIRKAGNCAPIASHYGTPRQPIKRCRVCYGTPYLREPGRVDNNGVPVCLPGMARCRLCWEAFAPLPALSAKAVLGSSAGTAMLAGGLW